ncbi:hypothetical protein ACJMK2_041308 [Sinanodonta woodiana]|uniref:Uncharacterized protein n=1 Tax=Sinanodonta woodiana TaxID=1069815 RepID=A0ABD3W6X9_SINWO
MDNTFNITDMFGPVEDTRTLESDSHEPEQKSSSLYYNSAVSETASITLSPRFDSDRIFCLELDQDMDSPHKEPLDDQDYSGLYGSSSSSYSSALSEIGTFTISTCLNRAMMQNLEYGDDKNLGLHRNPSKTSDISGSSSSSYASAVSHMDSYMLSQCLNEDLELANDVFDDLDFKYMLPRDNQGTSELDGSSSSPYYSSSSETGCIALLPCVNIDKIDDLSDEDGYEDVDLNRKFPLDAHQNEESTPVCNAIIQTHYGDNLEIGHDGMDAESYCCNSNIACEGQEKEVDKQTQASSILEAQKGEEKPCYAGITVSTLNYDSSNTDNDVPLCNSVGAGGGPDKQGDLGPSTASAQAVANQAIPPKHGPEDGKKERKSDDMR